MTTNRRSFLRICAAGAGLTTVGHAASSLAGTAKGTPSPRIAYKAVRLKGNPIIHPGMPGLEGSDGANINGPSLLRAPAWVAKPLGRYYLYFAHHTGKYIRLAFADALTGPWRIYPGGVLSLDDAPGGSHIASPDVHVDSDPRRVRMYFHQPARAGSPSEGQVSYVALSEDGLHFRARPEVLGEFYFRVFHFDGWYYALAKHGNTDGIIYRSRDGLSGFEPGPRFLPGVRHTAVWIERATLYVVYSIAGDAPESLKLATIDLAGDWKQWEVSDSQLLLKPEMDWEGANLPVKASKYGPAHGAVNALRDPCVFEEGDERYLLYSVAGEQGIAIARIEKA